MAPKPKSSPAEDDWTEEWFEEHEITEDDDKSFLRSRAMADQFVEEARKRRNGKSKPKKGLFGGRRGD